MAFFRITGRLLPCLMLCGTCWSPPLPARDAAAYLPDAAPDAPVFWWALDTSSADSQSAGERPVVNDIVTALQDWLASSRPGLRPYPPDGIRLGLLAVVPDRQRHLAARVLHPPLALDADHDWPAQSRSRLAELTVASLSADGQHLEAMLPALHTGVVTSLELAVPVQAAGLPLPALHVDIYRDLPEGGEARLGQGVVQARAGPPGYWLLDLSVVAAGALPEARWRFSPLSGQDGSGWQWRDWSSQLPATWFFSWTEPAHRASGREQLTAVLASLRMPAQAIQGGDADALWQALARLQAGDEPIVAAESGLPAGTSGCGSDALLQLGLRLPAEALAATGSGLQARQIWQADRPGLPWQGGGVRSLVAPDALAEALDIWRDRALAPAPVLSDLVPRMFAGHLLGFDAAWLQPVPGRLAWTGNQAFFPCAAGTDCPLSLPDPEVAGGGLRARLDAAAGRLTWLSDAGLAPGQPLQPWRDLQTHESLLDDLLARLGRPPDAAQREALRQSLQHELMHPPLPQGQGIYLDDGPDLASVTGRRGYLAWGLADGGLLMLAADSGEPLWGWRPAGTLTRWLRHRQDPAVTDPALVRAGDWQWWPGNDGQHPAAPRVLYGLADGQLLALDISQPLQPRSLFGLALPEGGAIGSLSVFTASGSSPRPLLLLTRRGPADAANPASVDALWLLDGLDGRLLWRAASSAGSAADVVDAALQSGWRAGWQRLVAADGRQLLYGVDLAGQVWRLILPGDGGLRPESLLRIADLSAPAQADGAESFQDALSLTWLADSQAVRLPALTLGSRSSGQGAATVFALLDRTLAGAAMLSRDALANWPLALERPPGHVWGWWRHLPAGEQLATSPRWLQHQVVLATEARMPQPGCAPLQWQSRLYRLPWRVAGEGAEAGAEVKTLAPSAQPLSSSPVLTGSGVLGWVGQEGAELTLPLPAATRVRTGKQPVALPR